MSFLKSFSRNAAIDRKLEERLYEFVAREIASGELKSGLQAKALVEADGDKNKVEGIYIKLRVQSLKDEFTIQELMDEEHLKRQPKSPEKVGSERDFSEVEEWSEEFKDFFKTVLSGKPDFELRFHENTADCVLSASVFYKTGDKFIGCSGKDQEILIKFAIDLWTAEIILDPENTHNIRSQYTYTSDLKAQAFIKKNLDKAFSEFEAFQKSKNPFKRR